MCKMVTVLVFDVLRTCNGPAIMTTSTNSVHKTTNTAHLQIGDSICSTYLAESDIMYSLTDDSFYPFLNARLVFLLHEISGES